MTTLATIVVAIITVAYTATCLYAKRLVNESMKQFRGGGGDNPLSGRACCVRWLRAVEADAGNRPVGENPIPPTILARLLAVSKAFRRA